MAFKVKFYATMLAAYVSLAYATCGCVCSSDLKPVPFIEELKSEKNCAPIEEPTESTCYKAECLKCGLVLECYIEEGAPLAVKEAIESFETFCPNEKTVCDQPCRSIPKAKVRQQEEYCPAQEGTTIMKCTTGQGISSIASYKICLGGSGATCTASGMCDPEDSGVYRCVATNCVTEEASITCVGEKCETDEDEEKSCPCMTME